MEAPVKRDCGGAAGARPSARAVGPAHRDFKLDFGGGTSYPAAMRGSRDKEIGSRALVFRKKTYQVWAKYRVMDESPPAWSVGAMGVQFIPG